LFSPFKLINKNIYLAFSKINDFVYVVVKLILPLFNSEVNSEYIKNMNLGKIYIRQSINLYNSNNDYVVNQNINMIYCGKLR